MTTLEDISKLLLNILRNETNKKVEAELWSLKRQLSDEIEEFNKLAKKRSELQSDMTVLINHFRGLPETLQNVLDKTILLGETQDLIVQSLDRQNKLLYTALSICVTLISQHEGVDPAING